MDIIKFGRRYRCYNCQALFYDLGKEVAICPKCGADQANAPRLEQRMQDLESQAIPEDEDIIDYEEEVEEKELELLEEEPFVDFDEEETDT